MDLKKISVTILTKNSEKYLTECLDSVKDFGEVIILDNGSEDKTLDICNNYNNIKIFKHPFIGFGPLKNLAISYTRNDWILSLDSDEIISMELKNEIKNTDFIDNNLYAINRLNFYNKQPVKCCGWFPDYVIRIFNKNKTEFNKNLVHESVLKKNMNVFKLKSFIRHYTYDSIEQLLDKMQKYSSLYAENHYNKKKGTPLKAISRSIFCFINHYFFRKGIFYGYRGLLISFCNAMNVFFKYMKLYEKTINNKNKE